MLIRYPGGKKRFIKEILSKFPTDWEQMDYVEPFFGSGSIGFHVMEYINPDRTVSIADLDSGIISLWKAVYEEPEKLCQLINSFVPNVEDFNTFHELDGTNKSITVENGFKKLALHQMSFSGLGAKAGGPIGGKDQTGKYKIGCRYNKDKLCKNVNKINAIMKRIKTVNIDCKPIFDSLNDVKNNTVVYLDPPYYIQGGALYVNNMNSFEHQKLADTLVKAQYEWVLSYDDVEPVRKLYEWAQLNNLSAIYTLAPAKQTRKAVNELIITKRNS